MEKKPKSGDMKSKENESIHIIMMELNFLRQFRVTNKRLIEKMVKRSIYHKRNKNDEYFVIVVTIRKDVNSK